jgi:hypothetical protein
MLYCSEDFAHLVGHDYAIYPRASQVPRYTHALLGNAWTLLFSRCSQILLYSSLTDTYGTCGDVGALLSGEVGSGAAGHMAALEPSRVRRQDPEPRDTWWRRSPPEQGGRIRSRGMRGGTGALPNRAVGSDTAEHAVARGHTACFLP